MSAEAAVKSCSSSSTSSAIGGDLSADHLQSSLKRLEKELYVIYSKRKELEQDQSEYKTVLEAFSKVPGDRRCYRMVGDVLVERTVQEVKPTLSAQKLKIEQTIESLAEEFDKITKEKQFVADRLAHKLEQQGSAAAAGAVAK
eukprot:GHVQ01006620.1.p2 GENE.GHVQ01006620.1~~GHVQ01006620.1.p2  ORF type:complete len:143 (+),score=37.84 GHVQ01006620.1:500-928(+)